MRRPTPVVAPGPFRADQIRNKDPYELSNGHAYRTMSTGNRGAELQVLVGAAIAADPAVARAGVDAGFSPRPDMLRAPDIAVLPGPAAPGWIRDVPPFAIEYADTGQDEEQLQAKLAEFLALGTKEIWVVRLAGVQRVEIHRADGVRLAARGDTLEVPGVLARPVPVNALFDPAAAQALQLQNLLARFGYRDVEDLAREAHEAGLQEGREAGLQEGREAGLQEGREAGLQEGREAGLQEGREAGLQEGREAGLQEGREAGLQEGREAGVQEGREDALRRAIVGVAEARGAPLGPAALAHLARIRDPDVLAQLVTAVAVRDAPEAAVLATQA